MIILSGIIREYLFWKGIEYYYRDIYYPKSSLNRLKLRIIEIILGFRYKDIPDDRMAGYIGG